MPVTLTCPRCTRTTTLLDADPVACPFCSPPPAPRRRGPRSVRVYFGGRGDEPLAADWWLGFAFLAFLVYAGAVWVVGLVGGH